MSGSSNANDYLQDGFFTQTLAQAASNLRFVQELVDWYIQVFNDSGEGEWAEQWTPDQVRKKLFEDTAGQHDRSFVTSWRDNGHLAGVTVIYVERAGYVLQLSDLPPACQQAGRLTEINEQLDWLVGADCLVALYREMGIVRQYRHGLAPVARMIHDSCVASQKLGSRYGCWWTSKQSRLFPIVVGLDCRTAYDFQDDRGNVFMLGETEQMIRRLRLPPGRVSQLMAARLKNLGLSK